MYAQAREAAEQCGRLTVPEIRELTPLSHLQPTLDVLLFGDETFSGIPISHIKRDPEKTYGFFVGPEGGFTPRERDFLRAHAQGVTLNTNILRAETAALVGISYLHFILK
jgi:16S rRNA (uracil1498-N3)-methyltransferase